MIDDDTYRNQPAPLRQVKKIDLLTQQVTLSAPRGHHGQIAPVTPPCPQGGLGGSAVGADGTLPMQTVDAEDDRWQTLENSVQVQFLPGTYRPGDGDCLHLPMLPTMMPRFHASIITVLQTLKVCGHGLLKPRRDLGP